MLTREEFEESLDRLQQYFRISVLEVRSRKEIGANHLQAVPGRRLDRLFDDGDLALVDLK